MSYGIIIPSSMAARNVDSYVKNVKYTADIENGSVVKLGALSNVRGEGEVYMASTPVTASLATDVFYIVNSPVNVLVNGKYSGLTDDPREFINYAGKVFNADKPMVGDEITLSVDAVVGTKTGNTHVIPANGTAKLTWGNSISGVSLALEYKGDTYVSVGNERVPAYKFLVVKA